MYAENIACSDTTSITNGVLEKICDNIAGTDVWDESMGTPNGLLVVFSGTLSNSPVAKARLVIKYTISSTEYEAVDNGAGVLIGEHLSGVTPSTIDYDTGDYELNFTSAPDDLSTLTGDYLYGQPGADWMLWYYGTDWIDYGYDEWGDNAYPSGAESETMQTYVLGTGDDIETSFTHTFPTDGKAFARYALRIRYTIGTTEYVDYSNEMGTLRSNNPTATTNRNVGAFTRYETIGRFYRSPHIASSAITWESPRQVDVTFSTPPDDTTDIIIEYWEYSDYKVHPMVYIYWNKGPDGDEDNWLVIYSSEYDTFANSNLIYSLVYKYFDRSPDQLKYANYTNGHRPEGTSPMRVWDQSMLLNIYSKQTRIVIVVETQTGYYQSMYIGQFTRPCTKEEYPYPLIQSTDQTGWGRNHTDITDDRHTGFYYLNGCSETPRRYICFPNNVWQRCDTTTKIKTAFGDGYDSDGVRKDIRCDPLQNGKLILHPIHIWSPYAGDRRAFLGIFDDIYKIHSSTIKAMDLIDDGTYTYRIFPDVARTEWYNFWCVKRE